ncbi:hypothetical protein [Micromonospora carbonacea]|uniref:Uncharacterized protein n=1 Tax=Micromonospora carbonacea TaxID=47853 RepID=A0A1C4WY02_9ACTN|nr:hypothetical protein [Micromonospora carbonacea]SCF01073.1 hypothetical protein GA0070563_104105 [Micromonospora carbonacea]
MKPYVGEASSDYTDRCAYARTPSSPKCVSRATVHVLVDDPTHGVVALATCTEHSPHARAAAPVVGEHRYGSFCGLPSTRWAGDRCELDDSGCEPGVSR